MLGRVELAGQLGLVGRDGVVLAVDEQRRHGDARELPEPGFVARARRGHVRVVAVRSRERRVPVEGAHLGPVEVVDGRRVEDRTQRHPPRVEQVEARLREAVLEVVGQHRLPQAPRPVAAGLQDLLAADRPAEGDARRELRLPPGLGDVVLADDAAHGVAHEADAVAVGARQRLDGGADVGRPRAREEVLAHRRPHQPAADHDEAREAPARRPFHEVEHVGLRGAAVEAVEHEEDGAVDVRLRRERGVDGDGLVVGRVPAAAREAPGPVRRRRAVDAEPAPRVRDRRRAAAEEHEGHERREVAVVGPVRRRRHGRDAGLEFLDEERVARRVRVDERAAVGDGHLAGVVDGHLAQGRDERRQRLDEGPEHGPQHAPGVEVELVVAARLFRQRQRVLRRR